MRLFVRLAVMVALAGCGSSSSDSGQAAPTPPAGAISGRVVTEQGQGQSGVQVVVHERTTNAKTETVSDSDGRFRLDVPTGTYDLGLDRNGDMQTATCHYGPILPLGCVAGLRAAQ